MIEWSSVLTALVTAAILGVFSGLGVIIRCLQKLHKSICNMERNGEKRKVENLLLIEGTLALMDAVKTGKTNGNITHTEDKLKSYIRETAVGG